jgi:hypothetical protein
MAAPATTSQACAVRTASSWGFSAVPGYRAPQWPGQDEPQQSHLDFEVDDLDLAEAALLRLGAAKPNDEPDDQRWRVTR